MKNHTRPRNGWDDFSDIAIAAAFAFVTAVIIIGIIHFCVGLIDNSDGIESVYYTPDLTIAGTSTDLTPVDLVQEKQLDSLTSRVTALDGGETKLWKCDKATYNILVSCYDFKTLKQVPCKSSVTVQTIGKEKPENQGDYSNCSAIPDTFQSVVAKPDNQ